ncbi:MAG: hypothetical protein ACYCUE_04915 [Steroidobacteraceae bacterium]
MSKGIMAGHVRAAVGGAARDFGRLAAVRDTNGYYTKALAIIDDVARLERTPQSPFRTALEKSIEKRTDELASHADRPTRENALSAAQHRELAREHDARRYVEESAGNIAGARLHESAADSHHRAAVLASEHDSDAPFASHRAREATRRANRLCHEQVRMPGHAAKAAGDGFSRPSGRDRDERTSNAFRSQPVEEPTYREPRGNARAFQTSGRTVDVPYESGYDYEPDEPAHPMTRLFGPPGDLRGSQMNWPGRADRGAPRETRSEGRGGPYDASEPQKGAGIAPGESLTAFAKRLMAGSDSVAISKSLDLAHALTVAGKLPETAYRAILRLRDFKARATKSTYRNIKADRDYGETVRAIRAAPLSDDDRDVLLTSIA